MKEVEIKIKLSPEETENVRFLIEELYGPPAKKISQRDIYYTSSHKDFIRSRECLRIREIDGAGVLTWKPPSDAKMLESGQFWKEEIDILLYGQISKVQRMLEQLDFLEYVVVAKNRVSFQIDAQTEVAIDSIDKIGNFLEVETSSSDVTAAQARNIEILASLNLSALNVETRPYRDIVKEAHKGKEDW